MPKTLTALKAEEIPDGENGKESKMALPLNIQLFAEGGEGNTDPTPNGGTNTQEGGNPPKTYTQEELDNIVNERTGRATKSALKSFFSQKGLSEEEANQAMNEYLETKAKNTPNVGELQSSIATERSARIKAQLRADAQLEAIKQGVDVKSIPHVLKLMDDTDCVDKDGKINADKLSEVIKKVLDDVPAFKAVAENSGGVRVGGDGEGNGQQGTAAKKNVPTKKWNRFNI